MGAGAVESRTAGQNVIPLTKPTNAPDGVQSAHVTSRAIRVTSDQDRDVRETALVPSVHQATQLTRPSSDRATGQPQATEIPQDKVELHRAIGGRLLSYLFNLLIVPVFKGFYITKPNETVVVSYWGKPTAVVDTPGIHWNSAVGRDLIRLSRKVQSYESPQARATDGRGNPISAGTTVTWQINDPLQAAFGVENCARHLQKQVLPVLQWFCSQYPLQDTKGQGSLRAMTPQMERRFIDRLQQRVDVAGVEIKSFGLSEPEYEPSIAKTMLAKQQVQANLDAKRELAEGITSTANTMVAALGIAKQDQPEKAFELSELLLLNSNDGAQAQAHLPLKKFI